MATVDSWITVKTLEDAIRPNMDLPHYLFVWLFLVQLAHSC